MPQIMEGFEHSLHSLLLDVPKIDLHCHLNGSISASLLSYLQSLHNTNLHKMEHKCEQQKTENASTSDNTKTPFVKTSLSQDAISIVDPQTRMHECFKMFDLIYNVMDNLTFTKLAVQDLLFHSAMERVCVLEIRTSLRDAMRVSYQQEEEYESTTTHKMASKQEYLQTVINTVEHLLTGHGVVCFTTGAFLHLDEMASEVQKKWEMEFESIYTNSFLHNAQYTDGSKNKNVNLCEVLHQRILPHLHSHMHVRLLVSVNRAKSIVESDEAITLAINLQHAQVEQFYEWLCNTIERCNTVKCENTNKSNSAVLEDEMKTKMQHTCWITGVDFSGNCYKNVFHDYTSSLSRARHSHCKDDIYNSNNTNNINNKNLECDTIPPSLAITLHAAEKYDDDELLEMIEFCPERFGHLVFISDKINLLLKQILYKGTGIELCMSSNLVTCGHTTAEQHHLGPLLQLWWNVAPKTLEECKECDSKSQKTIVVLELQTDSEIHNNEKELVHDEYSIKSILLSDEGYNNSEQFRLAHRLARWHKEEQQEEEESNEVENTKINKVTESITSTHYNRSKIHKTYRLTNYSIPNISFHTDDRGVFDISLTSELGLVCSHPLFCTNRNYYDKNCTNSNNYSSDNEKYEQECVKVIRLLERLTLVQVFELPWPVLYLTYIVLPINVSDSNDIEAKNECLSSFDHFAHMCNKLFYNHCSSSSSSSSSIDNRDSFSVIMTCMSQWELRWLSDNFDRLLKERDL